MRNRIYSALEIDLMLGLDDLAHNRMGTLEKGKFVPVANYGRRNRSEKCYCQILRKLGIKR